MSNDDVRISSADSNKANTNLAAGQADAIQRITETLLAGASFNVRVTDRTLMPFIQMGDLMVFVSTTYVKTRVGDFILYRSSSGFPLVRRIVRKCFIDSQAYCITRSDVNPKDVDQVRAGQLLGRLSHVERHGKRIGSWRLNRGLLDWATSYGTRHPLSKLTDLVLSLLPLKQHQARREQAELAAYKAAIAAAAAKKAGRSVSE